MRGLLSGFPSARTPYGMQSTNPNFPGHLGDEWCGASVHECGVNHDMAKRRNHLNAVLMATKATTELANQVRVIVGEANWRIFTGPNWSDPGANQAWDRAQAISMGAGQWGPDGSQTSWKVAEATVAYDCTRNPFVSDSDCPLRNWDLAWGKALFAIFSAAPPAHATGNDAGPFPAMGVPTFDLSGTSQDTLPAWANAYRLTVGKSSGLLLLSLQNGLRMVGKLEINGVTTVVEGRLRDPALTPNSSASAVGLDLTAGGLAIGRLYAVGPNPSQVVGYIRNAEGVPEGLHGAKLDPARLPAGAGALAR